MQDQYLFRLAYPSDRKEYEESRIALQEIMHPFSVSGHNPKTQVHSLPEVIGSFSYAITRWLTQRFPGAADLESSKALPETIKTFFSRILPRCEYETISAGHAGLLKRIDQLKGQGAGNRLQWLLQLMEDQLRDEREKEQLFEQMQVFIRFRLPERELHPAEARAPVSGMGYHRRLSKKTKVPPIIRQPLPPATELTAAQKNKIIDLARISLLFLHRETEPFTYADPEGLELFELENGWSVALFSMQPGRRLSIESYIGYLAFKNAVPLAYGGGWLFGKRCQFGINIFPAFRGGTSLLLMAQLLRVYHQHYGAARFVVKPYQFGWHNPEAIRSGAFWFYDKAGFRPEDPLQSAIATAERKKKKLDPQYRTPASILKGFTRSSLVLSLEADAFPCYDAARLSEAVTAMIRERFGGHRRKAIRTAMQEWRKYWQFSPLSKKGSLEKSIWEEWSLLLLSSTDTGQWTAKEKQAMSQLIGCKARAPEAVFINRLQQLGRLWQDWNRFVSNSPGGME